jgi:hypothetical protein
MSDTAAVNGNELLKRIWKIARERRLHPELVRERGARAVMTLSTIAIGTP